MVEIDRVIVSAKCERSPIVSSLKCPALQCPDLLSINIALPIVELLHSDIDGRGNCKSPSTNKLGRR